MNLGLSGKHALITDVSTHVGLAIARVLASEGCNICVCAKTDKNIKDALLVLKKYNVEILTSKTDHSKESQIQKVFKLIRSEWGELDVLVNNIANSSATRTITKQALVMMKRSENGRVVNLSSTHSKATSDQLDYQINKYSDFGMIKAYSLKHDLVKKGITFNTVIPGTVHGTPDDVAYVVAFVCSEKAQLLNGAFIPVDGGEGRSL